MKHNAVNGQLVALDEVEDRVLRLIVSDRSDRSAVIVGRIYLFIFLIKKLKKKVVVLDGSRAGYKFAPFFAEDVIANMQTKSAS